MKRISRLAALTIATSLTVSGMTVATAEEAQTPPAAVEQAAEITKEDQGNPTTGNNNGSPDTKDKNNYENVKETITALADSAIKTADEAIAAAKAKDPELVKDFVKSAEKAKAEAEAIKKALPTTNDEPGLMELMNRADAAKYQAESAKADIEKVTSPEDLAKARKAANDAADAFIRDIDEALKVAKKKQQTDTLKELVAQAESAKADAEKAKKAIPGITSTTALNDLTKYLKGARDEFRKVRATIDTVPNAQNKSSGNSKVKTIIAVLLGVLGLGAIAAAIVQFAGPALKAFGINLPGL
ncbi:hypothetical protein [Corynebacterium matruchotii]|jgi:hypothetical protein|uniref:Uncharacterized protein n=2 Tax=Corynebacterium matruchotii TaxID=43768 RepID=E0DD97_9CORY|nr:hypothetical protein [Corynebacterium matruchotii]EFM49934.1 hypothetical protein HMPREF0299_6298 [Corynebacterium matruchotii ATCC 14266]KAB1922878.1 hypothetical protein F8196_11620 [Corynebacterium matruchotii]QIP45854.1 hypothetical protein HBA49_10290 [Corynebacterium matruchotii]SPW23822.1 Uncharacterised protein [Corynebacterium matruchotii]